MSNKVPQIRFNGYSDAWLQRNLSELLQERNQQIEPNEEYKLMSFVAGTGVTPKGERYDRSALVTNDSKKYKVTEFGDFIYSSNNLETGSIGFNRTGKAVISPVYSIFYSTENADSRFIGLLSSQKKFIHSMVRYRQGVVYGQWRIHESDFLKIAVSIPTMDEQDKIIDFFERFDNLIAANQRKLDLLKEQKKGYLQKMFPKNGSKVPELRFAGFADDWEERKLSDIADRFDNLRVPITASDRKSGDTPYYGANGIQDYVEGFTHDGEFILVAEDGANDLKNYPVQYVNGKVWVNNHAHVLQGKKTITDNKFLMNSIKNFNIEPFLVGGGRAKLNADVMMKLNVLLPTFEEQEKIGSFFKQLDDTITLHQRKLYLLKEQKKGFLQNMFV